VFKDTVLNLTGDHITDFNPEDTIDLTNMKFTGKATVNFDNSTHLLTIDPDGAGIQKAFTIMLDGGYDPAHFHLASDGGAGTVITYDGLHIV
jgi:hypothetical protein